MISLSHLHIDAIERELKEATRAMESLSVDTDLCEWNFED